MDGRMKREWRKRCRIARNDAREREKKKERKKEGRERERWRKGEKEKTELGSNLK